MLLAAGASRRMGQPKQLLPWGKGTLIEHQINAFGNKGNPLFVVLGSDYNLIAPVIKNSNARIIFNHNWKNGMGSSISFGVQNIVRELPDSAAIMIVLLDQPLIPEAHFDRIISVYKPSSEQIIVTGSSKGRRGVPALFDRCYFDDLAGLNGDRGAKKIIEKNLDYVTIIVCEECLDDIDTHESYKRNLEKFMNSTGTNSSS